MSHRLPELPFSPDALVPFLSPETFDYHHGKHHRTYVTKLNGLLEGTEQETLDLVDLVRQATGAVFNNAAQHFNHSLYWASLTPKQTAPSSALQEAIDRDFGSMEGLRETFTTAAKNHFGSGWCWLVRDNAGTLSVATTSDAECPLTGGGTPILTCDVWEHAYYVDYRNARPDYVDAFWNHVNWNFVSRAFENPNEIEGEILGAVQDGRS